MEVITSYCFGKSSNALDYKNFENDILAAIDQTLPMIWVFRHLPLIKSLLLGIPECFASVLKPSTVGILQQRRQMGKQIDDIMKDLEIGYTPVVGSATKGAFTKMKAKERGFV